MKSKIWIVLALLAALLALVAVVSAQTDGEGVPDGAQPATFEEVLADPLAGVGIVSEPKGATGSAIYLIRLSDPPVASYRGGIPGLEATNPGVQGQRNLDMNSAEAIAYRDYLLDQQSQLITNIEQTLGRSVEVAFQYYAANNGIATYLTPEEAREVSKLPGVIFIQRNFERELHTDNGPTWIGAPAIWGGTQTTRNFYANLDGSQEVPPNGSSATGEGTFAYDFETMELSWDISHTGLVSITAAHIHSATVGVNGGVQIPLDHTINPIVGSATLTAAQEWALVNGRFYVNVHTSSFPGGEIRGQMWQTGSMGESIIIGVIDTGINPSNPSFADLGDDSYDHTNPWGSGTYVGVCDPGNPTYDPTFPCNDKLIGAWGYPTVNGGDPRDYDGHGSHTASTAGGNFLDEAPVVAPTLTITPSISGVAPHANIVAYAACCTLAALTAAIDQIVIDGVNVVNYSIGSASPSDLWNDFDTVGYLNARDAGIFVVTSAGNNGPGSETVGSPADAPWLTSVGASTHGRSFLNVVQDMAGGDTTPPADIEGKGLTAGYGPAPIVYAGDFGDALCLAPFPGGTWTNGEIVVCDRGINARVEKGQNVLAGGAGGMVLANVAANGEGFGTLNGDSHFLPAVHIANADGLVLKAWLASGSGHMATISGVSFSGAYGDIMAGFSSRGANRAAPDIIVPSVSAPGVDIIAATGVADSIEWNVISGTSMASPHTAGAGALIMAIHPEWSPAEIQSALMSTAFTAMLDNDGVTPADPFDTGSGRVNLSATMNAGLVLDETTDNYWAADPAMGGDVKTLNLASLGNDACVGVCSWTRTVSSTLSIPVTWTVTTNGGFPISVTPSTFVLGPGATQVLTITADVSGEPTGNWLFGEIVLSPATAVHSPEDTIVITSTPALAITDDAYIGVGDGNDGFGVDAGMVCDTIDTTGMVPAGAAIDGVAIDLGITHTWIGDLTVKLQSPDGTILAVLERPAGSATNVTDGDTGTGCCGDSSNLNGAWLNFADSNANDGDLMGSTIPDGQFVCTDDGICSYWPNPDQALLVGSSTANFTAMVGGSAEGAWTLCAADSVDIDTGTFDEWGLTLDYAGGGVPEAHFPVAVVSQAGEIPDSVEIDARRDAGSDLMRDLTALEITDLTIESFGLAQGDQYDFQLNLDSTNGDPYDNLNEVWWITMTVPAGAHRLVAEVVDSTAVDIDLYVGTGPTPSAATQVCASTSATFVEYCNVDDPTAGTWWVLVQNWAEGTPPDDITTIVGLVEDADAGNLTVTGPASVPGGTPFDLRLFWDEGQMDAGEYWYGAFSIGSDAGNPGNIGTVNVDVDRVEDDVTKTANTGVALPGETVTYTITVLPNLLTEDITYWLTDTIPTGMTYVSGSAIATAGTVAVSGNQVTWTGMQSSPYGAASNYVMTTSSNDPNCDTGFGGYVNLQDFGILAQPTIVGDTVTFVAFSTGNPINYYGTDYTGMGFTDDGFAIADPATNNGGSPWVPQSIPDANLPNNVLPVYWNDFELFYDSAANQGVSLATAGAPGGVIIIEYDDIEPFGGGTPVMDFEIVMARAVDDTPGVYEIVYAYDNVASTPSTATIGVENQPGDVAVALVNDGDPSGIVTDGFMVCFDLQGPQLDPVTITYAVTVDAGASGTLTNSADSTTSTPGSTLATTSVDVIVPTYAVQVAAVDDALSGAPGTSVMYTVWVTNTGNVTDTFGITTMGVWPASSSSSSVTLGANESTSVMITVDIPASAGDGDMDVTAVTATSQTDSSATASVDLTTTAVTPPPTDTFIYLPIILKP